MAFVLQDNFTDDDSLQMTLNASSDYGAQTFTASSAYTISRIAVRIYKGAGDNVGTVNVELQGVTGGGDPDNGILASGTIADALIGTDANGAFVNCDLAVPYALTNGVEYAIVVHGASLDATNIVFWNNGGTYATGTRNFSVDSGSTWGGPYTNDCGFQCYSGSVGGGVLMPIAALRLLRGI